MYGLDLEKALKAFKKKCHDTMDLQEEGLKEFGKISKRSKGGFSITHSTGTRRVTRVRRMEPLWDERAIKATELIKDFLFDKVKKSNRKLFEVLLTFIERDKNGNLEYSKVMNLIKHEDKWSDPRWVEGLKLVKDSFSYRLRGYNYEFKIADKDGKFKNIELSFASI